MSDDPAGRAGAPAIVSSPAEKLLPSHVILLDDYGSHLAGKVLPADADLVAQLDAEHARYREASPAERALGGFA